MIFSLIVVVVCLSLALQNGITEALALDSFNQHILYTDILSANTSESLDRVRNLELQYYEFKYDSVVGRKQLGALPKDVSRLFPESVDIVKSYTFPSKDRSQPPTVLNNFPVVDKNGIFMHGLAAFQELIKQYDELNSNIRSLQESLSERQTLIGEMDKNLDKHSNNKFEALKELAASELLNQKKRMDLEQTRVESDANTLKAIQVQEKAMLALQSELARERLKAEEEHMRDSNLRTLQLEQKLSEETLSMYQRASSELQERRAELEKELVSSRVEFEKQKIKEETEARIEQDLAKEESNIRKMQAKAKLDNIRNTEMIKTIFTQILIVVSTALSNPTQLFYSLGALLALLLLYYASKEVISVIRDFVQTQIGKPTLVRETSYHYSILPQWLSRIFTSESLEAGSRRISDEFKNVILHEDVKERITQIALATRNTNQSGAPYRHVLLHGPPGTGKTLIAKTLAQSSGMDYAIMSGGDVGPLGEDAVNQMHKLFKWASSSRKGLMLFIDEAEAFLNARSSVGGALDDGGVHRRHALNALLYQTGTQSKDFMLVLATNRPEDIDSAVLDRMDVSVLIDLPDMEERVALTKLYMKEHVENSAEISAEMGPEIGLSSSSRPSSLSLSLSRFLGWRLPCRVEEECRAEKTIVGVAQQMTGFSGREISKMCIAMHHAMLLSPDRTLTPSLYCRVLEQKLLEHSQKRGFIIDTDNNHNNQQSSDSQMDGNSNSNIGRNWRNDNNNNNNNNNSNSKQVDYMDNPIHVHAHDQKMKMKMKEEVNNNNSSTSTSTSRRSTSSSRR